MLRLSTTHQALIRYQLPVFRQNLSKSTSYPSKCQQVNTDIHFTFKCDLKNYYGILATSEPQWHPSDLTDFSGILATSTNSKTTSYNPYLSTRSRPVEPPNVRHEVCYIMVMVSDQQTRIEIVTALLAPGCGGFQRKHQDIDFVSS